MVQNSRAVSQVILTRAQTEQLAASLPDLPGSWSLVAQESYDGQVLLLVTPEDDDLASFAVDAEDGGIAVATMRNDVLQPCGRFETMSEVIAALRHLTEAEACLGAGRRRM